jgi:hypothetical protein
MGFRIKETENTKALFRCAIFIGDRMNDEATAANLNTDYHINKQQQ